MCGERERDNCSFAKSHPFLCGCISRLNSPFDQTEPVPPAVSTSTLEEPASPQAPKKGALLSPVTPPASSSAETAGGGSTPPTWKRRPVRSPPEEVNYLRKQPPYFIINFRIMHLKVLRLQTRNHMIQRQNMKSFLC